MSSATALAGVVEPPGVEHRLRAERLGQPQRAGGHVDGDDPRAGRDRDLDGRQPDPAAAVHRDPLAGPDLPDLHHRPPGGGVAAAERGGGGEGQLPGQRDQVDVGGVQHDLLGERAPVREARLRLAQADLVVAGQARRAAAAGAHERDGDPVADPPPAYAVADRRHGAGQLVAGHVRQHDVGVVPLPGVPVAPADPGGADLDDDPAGRRLPVRDLADVERCAVRLEDRRPHGSRASRRPMSVSRPCGVVPAAPAASGSSSAASSSRP